MSPWRKHLSAASFVTLAAAACTGKIDPAAESGPPGQTGATSGKNARPGGASGASGGTAGTSTDTPSGGAGMVPPVTTASFDCKGPDKGASPARLVRLTPSQYVNSVTRAFTSKAAQGAKPPQVTSPLVLTTPPDAFSSAAKNVSIDAVEFSRSMDTAATLADEAVKRIRAGTLLAGSCLATVDAAGFPSCITETVKALGPVLLRRPITQDEVTSYVAAGTGGLADLGIEEAAAAALQGFFLAPSFIFRTEAGEGPVDGNGAKRLGGYELASAISYALTDGPPDDALMKAAGAGDLLQPGGVRAQVKRLIGTDYAGAPGVARFFRELYQYERAKLSFKDPATYPFQKPDALISATDRFVQNALTSDAGAGFLRKLFTSDAAFVTKDTAANYGLDAASRGTEMSLVSLKGKHGGILTEPSWLSGFAKPNLTSPVSRGRFVRQRILCGEVPSIPIDQVPPLKDLGPDATMRDRLAEHSKGSCSGCHKLMDPLGLGLEDFDEVGRFRTMEKGKPVNASGVLDSSETGDGPFTGGVELSARLATSPAVERCFIAQSFRFWMGRFEATGDECALAGAYDGFKKSEGGNYVEMLSSLLESRAYQYRRAP